MKTYYMLPLETNKSDAIKVFLIASDLFFMVYIDYGRHYILQQDEQLTILQYVVLLLQFTIDLCRLINGIEH